MTEKYKNFKLQKQENYVKNKIVLKRKLYQEENCIQEKILLKRKLHEN